jgi:hypothetical protein
VLAGRCKPQTGCTQAHHIVPLKDPLFQRAQVMLAKVGIDLDDASNGMWLDCGWHRRVHGSGRIRYAFIVNQEIGNIDADKQTRAGVEAALLSLRLRLDARVIP